jgi:hypothetical protein
MINKEQGRQQVSIHNIYPLLSVYIFNPVSKGSLFDISN